MRFCFISTNAASKTASSEVIDDNNGYRDGSNGGRARRIPLAGDVVKLWIEKIGSLTNTIV